MGIIGAIDLVRSGMYVISSMLAGVLTDKLVSIYIMYVISSMLAGVLTDKLVSIITS